jgi:hypothetical protein
MKYTARESSLRRLIDLYLESLDLKEVRIDHFIFFVDTHQGDTKLILMKLDTKNSQLLVVKPLVRNVHTMFGIQMDKALKLIKISLQNKLGMEINSTPEWKANRIYYPGINN